MPKYNDLEFIAGYVAATPEVKQSPDGNEFTTFRVGVNRGYALDDETKWFGVAVNKQDLQDYVQATFRKGTPVVCEGTSSTREWEGNTYYNFTAFRVGVVDWFLIGGPRQERKDEDL